MSSPVVAAGSFGLALCVYSLVAILGPPTVRRLKALLRLVFRPVRRQPAYFDRQSYDEDLQLRHYEWLLTEFPHGE